MRYIWGIEGGPSGQRADERSARDAMTELLLTTPAGGRGFVGERLGATYLTAVATIDTVSGALVWGPA